MPIHFNSQIEQGFSPLQERAIKEAFLTLYECAGAKKNDHFLFTSSGAEGVNHAVFAAYLDITRKTGKNHFLCTSLDEAPAIMAMSRLQEVGCLFQMVSPDREGRITRETVTEMLTPRTAMLSMSWACSLTGVLQPVLEIAELCRERGILFHVEGTHVFGKGDFSFEECGADILTFRGAPPGTGGLFFRDSIEISPLILGGADQGGMRGGIFSFSHLIELAKWAKEEHSHCGHYGTEVVRLKALFEKEIMTRIPHAKVLFRNLPRVPHITSFLFPGAASDSLCFLLNQKGVYTTFGGNTLQLFSHLLKACGVQEPDCHCGLSFGFSPHLSEEELLAAVEKIAETVHHLQRCSEGVLHELR